MEPPDLEEEEVPEFAPVKLATPRVRYCRYIWTTNNGVYFHHCGLSKGHAGDHVCDFEQCELNQ
jgi:hypothetical protein